MKYSLIRYYSHTVTFYLHDNLVQIKNIICYIEVTFIYLYYTDEVFKVDTANLQNN